MERKMSLLDLVKNISVVAPLATKIEEDKDLRLTHNQYIVKLRSKICNINLSDREKLDMDPFPKPHILAVFSSIVYDKVYGDKRDDSSLPPGWCLLTGASNKKNGYFGAAYCNIETQQVVIAHRGTEITNTGALKADYHICEERYTPQMNSAVTFAHEIQTQLQIIDREFNTRFRLSFTGHSLGGYLAQITTFSAKYLTKYGTYFTKNAYSAYGNHPHTVVFESPGCKAMLAKLKRDVDVRYGSDIVLGSLDITTYLSAPNWVNAIKMHLGEVYRIDMDFSKMSLLGKTTFIYHLETHKIKTIVSALNPNTGNASNVVPMADWPCGLSELSPIYRHARHSNNYHPQLTSRRGHPIRYQNKICSDEKCNTRIFSEAEYDFLQHWKCLKDAETKLEVLDKFFKAKGFESTKHVIPEFKIDQRTFFISCSTCEDLSVLIKHTKQLFRWFPVETSEAMKRQTSEVRSKWRNIYSAESKDYISSLAMTDVIFKYNSDIEDFINSGKNVLIMKTNQESIQILKLNSIMNELHGKQDAFFLQWRQILHLDQCFDIDRITSSQPSFLIIAVIDVAMDDKVLLEKISKNKSWKTIFVTDFKTDLTTPLESNLYVEINCRPFTFRELRSDSQSKVLGRNVLLNDQFSDLMKLFSVGDQTDGNVFEFDFIDELLSGDQLEELIVSNEPMILGTNLPDLSDLEVTHVYLNECTDVQHLANLLQKPQVVEKLLFVVASDDIKPEELKERLWKHVRSESFDRSKLDDVIDKCVFVILAEDRTENFKQICRANSDKIVYLIEVNEMVVYWYRVYNPTFYITRSFHCRKILKDDFHKILSKKDLPDVLIFSTVKDKTELAKLLNVSQTLLNPENIITSLSYLQAQKTFNKYIKNERSVHLFTKDEDGKLTWIRSFGSIDNIREHITQDVSNVVDEARFISTSEKVVIISDEPGMGKSTSLTSLSHKINSSWVIRINLKDCQKAISNLVSMSPLNLENITEFLTYDSNFGILEKSLLRLGLEGKISATPFLLFDGFDEINETLGKGKEAQATVLKLLRFLKDESKAAIWVTTRRYPCDILENNLSVFASKFQRISEIEQMNFFKRFWRSNPKHILEPHENELMQYGEELFKEAKKSLGEEIVNVIGIPLQLRMLAEVFQPDLHLTESARVDSSNHVKNVLDLYRKFIKIKYEIYLSNKTGLSDKLSAAIKSWILDTVNKRMMKLGFQQRFSDIPQGLAEAIATNLNDEEEDELNKIGLVQSNRMGDMEFIHRTFAEYFSSQLIFHWLQVHNRKRHYLQFCEFLFGQIFMDPQYKVVRLFFDQMLHKFQLHEEANKALGNVVNDFWREKNELFYAETNGTLLHLLALEGFEATLEWLLGAHEVIMNLLLVKDRNWDTPINIAASNSSEGAMRKFCDYIVLCSDVDKRRIIMTSIFKTTTDLSDAGVTNFVAFIKNQEDEYKKLKYVVNEVLEKRYLMEEFLEAAQKRNLVTMELCLEQIGNQYERNLLLNVGNTSRETALHISCANKEEETVEIVRLLLDEGAKVDIVDKNGCTPFLLAARNGKLEAVRLLKEKYSDINVKDNVKMTPVSWASKFGHCDVVTSLVDWKCDLTLRDKNGITPFQHAAKNGRLKVVEFLLPQEGVDVNVMDWFGKTALSWAARSGHEDVVTYLLENGADIDSRDRYGATALLIAVKTQQWKVVKLLVDWGAALNIPNFNGDTALMRCKHTGKKDMCAFLKSKGAQ